MQLPALLYPLQLQLLRCVLFLSDRQMFSAEWTDPASVARHRRHQHHQRQRHQSAAQQHRAATSAQPVRQELMREQSHCHHSHQR